MIKDMQSQEGYAESSVCRAGEREPCVVEHKHHTAEDGWNHEFVGVDGGHSEVESVAWDRRRGRKM